MITGVLYVDDLPTQADIGKSLTGRLFYDKATHGNHPFPDGTMVNTSYVKEILHNADGTFVTTRNSFYEVVRA